MDNLDLKQRVALYRNFDEARQKDLEQLAIQVETMNERLSVLQADIEDEQVSRRNWRRRAEEAENAVSRNQFVLVLIDGDGYYFKEAFLKEASDSGGARAAYSLFTEVQQYLQNNGLSNPDIQIMVNVYANKSGLARFLCDTNILQIPNQLDQFFCSFSQSRSLFQFIDCGFGKERADAKFRDTYRFYAYNAHCKHIFLACCHDNGYVAELDRYRHDPIASPKTILVQAAQAATQYSSLPFPVTRFNTVFREYAPQFVTKAPNNWKDPSPVPEPQPIDDAASATSHEAIVSPAPPEPQTWSAMASQQKLSTKVQVQPATSPRDEKSEPRGIAINKYDQRIDLPLRQPNSIESQAFEARIQKRKLCNRHHLNNTCSLGKSCGFDHDPITPSMLNTLKLKARSIPCSSGQHCRQADCFYGHQCPWGKSGCNNMKCGFHKAGMHSISDTEVARIVPAEL